MEEPSPSPKDRKSQPTWRLPRGSVQWLSRPFALCFHPHFREPAIFGDSVHYEIRLFELKALQSSDRSVFLTDGPSSQLRSHL